MDLFPIARFIKEQKNFLKRLSLWLRFVPFPPVHFNSLCLNGVVFFEYFWGI